MPPAPSRALLAIALAASLVLGGLIAVQSRINGELGLELGDGFLAALFSFGSGLVVLTIAMLVWRPGRTGLREVRSALRERRIPWWFILGGLAGGFLVLTQGLTAGVLGVALFTISTVAGQTLSALAIDRRGLGTMQAKPLTLTRLLGTALALVAVAYSVSSRVETDIPVWMLVLPFLAGIGIGWQQAVNGQVKLVAGSVLTATWLNFMFGTAVLIVIAVIHSLIAGLPEQWPSPVYLYLGGMLGVLFIASQTIVVRILGVLLMGLALVAGQLVASVLIDVVVPTPGHDIALSTLIGTAATLIAVVIAAIPSRALTRPRG